MAKIITKSEKETKNLAAKLAKELKGRIIALSGELGAGKTTFVQGFAKGLGIKEKIISPTYILIRQHQIPNSTKNLFHIDLYRLEEKSDILSLGLEEIFSDSNNIVVIEWAEKLETLPKNAFKIKIHKIAKDKRRIEINFNIPS